MLKISLITVFVLAASVTAKPLVTSYSIMTSPMTSASLVAPVSSPFASIVATPVDPAVAASYVSVPFASVSDNRYSIGSSLNWQDLIGILVV
ncbi:unnamed protein product, partial [Iphiclides podalirius]